MSFVGYVIAAVIGYLLGSIPTGFIVARAKGVDIRSVGSGNIGATNVLRSLGKPAGVAVLAMDVLKGWLAVEVVGKGLAQWLGTGPGLYSREWLCICAAACAILGHNYTCWLSFRGGKGIATSAGVLLALVPTSLLIILTVWVVVFVATRYVSLASIMASATLPFAAWITGESWTMVIITLGMAILAIGRHGANIRRLKAGTEHKFGSKAASESGSR